MKKALLSLGICALAVLGSVLALFVWNQATRKDKPENYVYLSERLFGAFPVEGTTPIKLSQAEVEVKLRELESDLDNLGRHCKHLAPIARQYSEIVKRADTLGHSVPQGTPILFGLAEALLGAYSGQREHFGNGGQKALDGTEKVVNFVQQANLLIHQRHVLAVEMTILARQFSGGTTNGLTFPADYAEHTPGILEFETRGTVTLVNSSGRDLHNCVISVRLSNAKGESYVFYFFTATWLKNEKRIGNYSDFESRDYDLKEIDRVEIGIMASEFSIESILIKKPFFGWPEPK